MASAWRRFLVFSAAVMLGGALGAVCRVMIASWMHGNGFDFTGIDMQGDFPFATLIVNIVGSFGLGLIVGLYATQARRSQYSRETWLIFMGTGFFGSFTTFSAFTYELVHLWSWQEYTYGISNHLLVMTSVVAHLGGGLLAASLGFILAITWRQPNPE